MLNFTHVEIDQWMTYMEYAGVEHFYFYDNCHEPSECVADVYQNDSRVTYEPWPVLDYKDAQNPAYKHHHEHHPKSKYEVCIDIDEYPFMPNDIEAGFLPSLHQVLNIFGL